MNQRLSRKEIKRDEFMESIGDAIEWVRRHARHLIGGALALFVAAIVVVIYLGYVEGREGRADEALSQALRVNKAALDPVAANPENPTSPSFPNSLARSTRAKELFEAVRSDYGSSDAAGIASVYLGQIAAEAGDLDTARDHWEDFLSGNPDHALAVEVRVNLMALERSAGRGDELVTELRAMLSGPDAGLPPDLLWYQLAVTLDELDRAGEAKEAYQRIVDEYPQSAFAPTARERTGASQTPFFGG